MNLRSNQSFFYRPSRSALPDDAIHSMAPSVFAPSPLPGVSSRYAFVPTARILQNLRSAGWTPVEAIEQTVRTEARRGFQKHLLRFQRADAMGLGSTYVPELVLTNSHDRSSAYQLHAGLYRVVCLNGLVVSDSVLSRISIRHSGFTAAEVTEASLAILEEISRVTAGVEQFRVRMLSPEESLVLATHAWRLRFPASSRAPVGPEALLVSRRPEDEGDNLWLVLNRLHENVLRGGQRDDSRQLPSGRQIPRSRPITGLDQHLRLNKALWDMAHRFSLANPCP